MRGASYGYDGGVCAAENPQDPGAMRASAMMRESSHGGGVPETEHEERCIMPSSMHGPSIHGPSVHGATFTDAVASLRSLMNPHKDAPRLKGTERAIAVRRPVKPKVKPKISMRPSTMRGASMSPQKSRRMVAVSFSHDDVPELPFEPVENYRPQGILRPTSLRGTPFGDDDGIECGASFDGIGAISEMSEGSFSTDDDASGVPEIHSIKPKSILRNSASTDYDYDASCVPGESSTKPKSRQPAVRRKSFGTTASRKNSFGTAVATLRNFMSPRRKSGGPKGAAPRMVIRRREKPHEHVHGASFGDDGSDSSESGESFGYDDGDVYEKAPVKPTRNLGPPKPRRKSFGEAMSKLRVLMSPRRKSTGHTNHCAPRMELRTPNTTAWESPRRQKSRRKLVSKKPDEPADHSKRTKSPRRKLILRREKSPEPVQKTHRPTNSLVDNQPVVPVPVPVKVKAKKAKSKDKDRSKSPVKPAIIPSDDSDRGFAFEPNYLEPGDSNTTEESEDVKSQVEPADYAEMQKAVEAEKRRKCKEAYKWYARMGQPNCVEMKRRVAAMPKSCNIDATYIDELPWTPGFRRLSVIEMNKLYLAGD